MKLLSKRWLINYVLIVLVCLFTYIGNRYDVQTGYKPENRVTPLKPQNINRVTIQTADDHINLGRAAGQWQIESPVQWLANNILIERILGITTSETDSRLSADEIDLSTIGLQFPKAILGLNDTRILFGDTNNIGKRRYLLINSTVYLLEDTHLPFITSGIPGLVDQRLLPRVLKLSRLKLGQLQLSKTDNGGWQDDDQAISPDQLNTLINHWQTLPASQIRPFQQTNVPRQKIIAELNNGITVEFFLMSIKPEIIIARPDLKLQYHFNQSHYYSLLAVDKNEVPEN